MQDRVLQIGEETEFDFEIHESVGIVPELVSYDEKILDFQEVSKNQ